MTRATTRRVVEQNTEQTGVGIRKRAIHSTKDDFSAEKEAAWIHGPHIGFHCLIHGDVI